MDMKLKLCFLFFCGLIGLCLAGCSDGNIKFYRESKFQDLMNDIKSGKPQAKTLNSSGVVIYRATPEPNKMNVNFGPKDIEFDLPIK